MSWEQVNTAQKYKVYVQDNEPIETIETTVVVSYLQQASTYTLSVSAVNSIGEGAKSESVSQMTRIEPVELVAPHINGVTYMLGKTLNNTNVTALAVYKSDDTWHKNGIILDGDIKFYATGNLIVGENYTARAVYGKFGSGSEILGMPTPFTVKNADLSLNAVSATDKVVSGKTEPNYNVRISQNGSVNTTIQADGNGDFSYTLTSAAVSDVIKVEVKIGTSYYTTKEVAVGV